MPFPLEVSFRNMDPSPAVEARIREKAAKLERFHDRIIGCTVVVEAPHRHHHKGKLYSVHIDISVPGADLVVEVVGQQLQQARGLLPSRGEHRLERVVPLAAEFLGKCGGAAGSRVGARHELRAAHLGQSLGVKTTDHAGADADRGAQGARGYGGRRAAGAVRADHGRRAVPLGAGRPPPSRSEGLRNLQSRHDIR